MLLGIINLQAKKGKNNHIQNTNYFLVILQIELLAAEQSLALNLFLSRCEMSCDELVDCIEDADETKIGLSAIRHLQNILPSHQEV